MSAPEHDGGAPVKRPRGRPHAEEPRKTRAIRCTDAEWAAINEVGIADVRAWAVAEVKRRARRAAAKA